MNNGTASRISELIPSSMRPLTTASGVDVTHSRKATVASPKQNAMGTPSSTAVPSSSAKKMTRFQLPMPWSQSAPRYSTPASAAIESATPARSATPWRARRSRPIAIMNALPTGTAAARTVFGHDSAGVWTTHSSRAYSVIGPIRITSSRHGAAIPSASAQALARGLQRDTSAVVRMCVPRRSATAAPRLASQRNRIDASSSAQGIGLLKTKRMITPARSTRTSPTTSAAAGASMAWPSHCSARARSVPPGTAGGASSSMALIPGSRRCPAAASRPRRRTWRASPCRRCPWPARP